MIRQGCDWSENGVRARADVEEDIPEFPAASDMLALTSLHEGLPRCAMEAMAASKPVLATDVRESCDLLQRGGGLLVPVGEPGQTAGKLLALLPNRELAREVGEVGHTISKRSYTST